MKNVAKKRQIKTLLTTVAITATMTTSQVATAKSTTSKSKTGIASWYGGKFHGRLTANGERFNKNAFTAAHKKYTFGTKLKVTNRRNGRSVVVCVNDRGPYSKNRIIDLSKAAASQIGMMRRGVARVKIEVISQPKSWRYGRKVC